MRTGAAAPLVKSQVIARIAESFVFTRLSLLLSARMITVTVIEGRALRSEGGARDFNAQSSMLKVLNELKR